VTFLTPWATITAAALALPALLFLYFLKLRRFPLRIPSTLLWRKSIEDLQVNAPFQRLRITLLFLLQLLILSLFILALGQPVIEGDQAASTRLIILIDRSASMNARDEGDQSRLDLAKAAALDIIDRLGGAGNPSEAMIIAFAASPQVVMAFDGDRRGPRDAVQSIRPTDEPADLGAALELADAFAGADEDEAQLPMVMVISDGGVMPPEVGSSRAAFRVRAAEVRYVPIGGQGGAGPANAGIVAISARRRFDDLAHVDLFLRLLNASPLPVDTALTVRVDDAAVAVRNISIPAATDEQPGEAAESFDLELPGGGLITAALGTPDALATDDIASAVMAAPQPPSILLIARDGGPDAFVLGLLESVEPTKLEVRSAAWFDQSQAAGEGISREFDLVVFDRVEPARLPDSPTLFFGGLPPGIRPRAPASENASEGGASRIVSWNRAHPLMRHVELDDLIFEGFTGFEIPAELQDDTVELAISRAGPVIGVIEGRDAQHVFVGFELVRSNWPADVSLIIFLKNVLDHAMGLRGSGDSISVRTGEVARVPVVPGSERLLVRGPADADIDTGGRSHVTLPAFRRAGVYAIEGAAEPMDQIAVNLADAVESDIRVRGDLVINAAAVVGGEARHIGARELWPWLVAAALALLVIEWMIYAVKARG